MNYYLNLMKSVFQKNFETFDGLVKVSFVNGFCLAVHACYRDSRIDGLYALLGEEVRNSPPTALIYSAW